MRSYSMSGYGSECKIDTSEPLPIRVFLSAKGKGLPGRTTVCFNFFLLRMKVKLFNRYRVLFCKLPNG